MRENQSTLFQSAVTLKEERLTYFWCDAMSNAIEKRKRKHHTKSHKGQDSVVVAMIIHS